MESQGISHEETIRLIKSLVTQDVSEQGGRAAESTEAEWARIWDLLFHVCYPSPGGPMKEDSDVSQLASRMRKLKLTNAIKDSESEGTEPRISWW